MNLLIIEPTAGGHHMTPYVQFFVRGAARRGWKVRLLTTQKSADHPAFKMVDQEMQGGVALSIMPEPELVGGQGQLSLFRKQIQYRKAMARGFDKLKADELPDLVYIMSLDAVDKAISVFGSPFGKTPVSGMFVSVKFHRHQMRIGPSRHEKLYKWLFERLLKNRMFSSINVIDEYFVEYCRQQEKSVYKKVSFVPDPGELEGSESVAQARAKFSFIDEQFVILVYGVLTSRKGIKELLEAVSLLNEDTPVSVLLAGQTSAEVEATLSQPMAKKLIAGGRLKVVTGYQNKDQEYRLFRSANAVWLGYASNFFGKSAVMAQTGSVGLPVLACNHSYIGAITRNYDLGLAFDPTDSSVVAGEIKRLQSDVNLQKRLGDNGRLFASQATSAKFGDALCTAIDVVPGAGT